MRRYSRLRYDIVICILLGYLISLVPAYFVGKYYENKYSSYSEEHNVEDGEIGGKALEDTFHATSVDDLLEHDKFTIDSKGIEYRNRGAGYYHGAYMYAVTLPSGEKIAARINMENVTTTEDSIYSGDSILPVGKIVYADLTDDKYFLEQIEYKEELSRKDFYIDMLGNAEKYNEEDYVSMPKITVQVIVGILGFIAMHSIGSKLGLFPRFLPQKNKEKSEWD